MYEQFYGFSTLPFAARPAAGEYYFSELQRQVLEALEARVGQGSCVCVLSGADGTGKTTLVESLCETVKDRISVFRVDAEQTPGETPLVQKIITALSTEVVCDKQPSLDECLAAQLRKLSDADQKSILIIDNADGLTASDNQMLSTLVTNPSLQMLLVANHSENEPDSGEVAFAELADHIAERYELLPFSPVETDTYIRVRLIQAGASPELFTPAAGEAVYRYSKGLPRLINRICDLALVYGYSRQSKQIDEQAMNFVLNDRWGGRQRQASDSDEAVTTTSSAPVTPASEEPVSADAPVAGFQAAADSAPTQRVPEELMAAGHTRQTGASSQADTEIARQLVELLRQGGEQRETKTEQTNERDIYDFIRLSMKYHQRHLERFTFGVVAGVVLLAAGGLWGFIAWQNGTYLPTELVSDQISIDASPASTVTWDIQPPAPETVVAEPAQTVELRAGVSRMLTPEAEVTPVEEEVPTVEQAALESPAETEKMMPDPAAAIAAQAELTARVEAKNRALQAEREKLERERRLLKKKLAAERAENERLELEREREHARAVKAQSMVKEVRKSARLSWDKINASTPDAFPEE